MYLKWLWSHLSLRVKSSALLSSIRSIDSRFTDPVNTPIEIFTSLKNKLCVCCGQLMSAPEFLALKHESMIFGHSSMMKQVRLFDVWPTENWLGSSLNHIQGWTTVRESYSRALEQGPLVSTQHTNERTHFRRNIRFQQVALFRSWRQNRQIKNYPAHINACHLEIIFDLTLMATVQGHGATNKATLL